MARMSQDDSDKALWITLAQSWVRLAEHVARVEAGDEEPIDGDNVHLLPTPEPVDSE
jgi:hypothetical protein